MVDAPAPGEVRRRSLSLNLVLSPVITSWEGFAVEEKGFKRLLLAGSMVTTTALGNGTTRRIFKFPHNLRWIDQLPKMYLPNLNLLVSIDGSL